jgi:diguanylate cyclase (GGDEF)-like protein
MVQAALKGAAKGLGYQLTYRVVWPDGSVRTVLETAEPAEGGVGLLLEGSVQDITEQVDTQRRIRQLAYFDPLTGLPNREFFRESLLSAVARCLRNDSRCAVMVLDIDRFARINDSLGPERGDQVLQVIGHRLRESMGDRTPAEPAGGGGLPRLKVARLAADEFGVLVSDVGPVDEVIEVAYRLLDVVRAPIRVPGQEITLAARVGVAMMPEHATEADALLKAAETALNRAKRSTGEQVALFSEEMKVAAFLRFTLEGDLRRAIGEEELQVVYQPIVDLDGPRIAKVEALVRWAHLARGTVPPPEFISLAEETGMIVPLTRAVIEQVCSDIAHMGDALPPDFRVSINLSGVNFMDPQLIPTIRAVLGAAQVPPSRIEFELTETVLMRDLDYATATLAQLREMDIRVAVDDFGTGYSSLAYLRRLAVNTLKIDRSFIGELHDSQGLAIVEAVIGLARSLGMDVVAEGVETPPSWRPCGAGLPPDPGLPVRPPDVAPGAAAAARRRRRVLPQRAACARLRPRRPAPGLRADGDAEAEPSLASSSRSWRMRFSSSTKSAASSITPSFPTRSRARTMPGRRALVPISWPARATGSLVPMISRNASTTCGQ